MAERNPSDDQAAFGVFPQLKRNRAKQDREAAKNVPIDLARGALAGVLGAPGDIESLIRMLPYLDEKTVLPTSEDIEKRIPLRSDTPVSKAATGLGILGGGFYTGPGSPLRVVGAIPAAVRHGAEEFAKASAAGAPNVVKREGGNWIQDTIDNSIRGLKSKVTTENFANYTPEQVEQMVGSDRVKRNDAINKWIESKIGRYVKSEMGTPSDPIRLLIEKREAEIADKFLKDQARANRMADRAAEEVDPRRKANLTRQAQRMLDDAVAQRDLAMEHTSHLPRGFQNVDANEFSDDVLKSVRKAEGFPEQGMGTTPSSRAWESKADMSIYPINVGEIQSYPANKLSRQKAIEEYNAYEDKLDQDVIKYLKSKGIEGQYMAGLMKMSGEEKAALVGDTKLKELLDAIPPYSNREPIYEMAGKESYINKLDPKSSVYSGDISGLHFDHIIDVLKEDVASGRITPEQLNKITMEQAVRRTADYDLERSLAMREAKIKQQEGFPVHKEYPDEGYKWIELTKPKITVDTPLPEGFRWLEPKGGYERLEGPSLLDPQRTRTYLGETKEDALKVAEERSMLGSEQLKMLEDALKYEGDTMGHCVGGYCPDVAEGRSRIYSLRDSKGEPHVTIEVQPQNEKGYYNSLGSTERADLLNKAIEYRRQTVPDWDEMKNPVERAEMLRDYLQAQNIEIPARIVQIKGKQNLRPIEKYDPYTQDFVKSGNWSDIGDLKNTGLFTPQQIIGETSQKVLAQEGIELPKLMTKAEADDYIRQAYKAAIKQNTNIPPPEGMKRGGVAISKNPDTMMLELGNKRMKEGGAEDDTKPYFGGAGTKKYAAAKKRAEQADVNLLKDPKTYAAVASFMGEAPDELGFSVLHPDYQGIKDVADPAFYAGTALGVAPVVRSLKAPAMALGKAGEQLAEKVVPQIMERGGMGADILGGLAQGTRYNVYLPHTPKNPDPTVGTRYKRTDIGGLVPRKDLDIEKLDKSSVKVFPWDASDRNKLVTEVSDIPLTAPVLLEGGDNYMRDVKHVKKGIAGASNEGIANRIQDRIDQASVENQILGGTGRVFGFPIRMGEKAEHAATFPTDIAMDLLKQGNLSRKEMDDLTNELRSMAFEAKGKGYFQNVAPVDSPEFLTQLREGIAGNKEKGISAVTDMNLRKALMDRLSQVKYQKRLEYNYPDLIGSVIADELKGVPKGWVGNVSAELAPFSKITPSSSSTYSHDFGGKYFASMPNMPVEFLMPNTYEGIYLEMKSLYPNAKPEALRNMTIGAMEKRKDKISEMIGPRAIDAVKLYQEGLKQGEFNPNDIKQIYDYMKRKKFQLKLENVKKAEGGAVTGDDLIIEERPL